MPPLILTVHFDSVSQTRFDRDRQLCFPPDRNLVPAHLTLFHQLPETEATEIALTELARQQGVFSVEVTGVISLGRGVAYKLESPSLQHLRTRLADRFAPHLIPQDRQPFRPHVVLQNKTTAEVARRTLAEIAQCFVPFSVQGLGLDLWQYLNGPWAFQRTFFFRLPSS